MRLQSVKSNKDLYKLRDAKMQKFQNSEPKLRQEFKVIEMLQKIQDDKISNTDKK